MKLKRKIPLLYYSLIVSVFTLIAFNLPVFSYAWENASMSMPLKVFVVTSLAVIMVSLNMMLVYLLTYLTRYVGRVLIAITLIIDALAEYFVLVYNIILDDTMISNVFNTRYGEASGYFSWTMLLFVIIFGVLPAIWVVWQPVAYGTMKKLGKVCGGLLGLSLILLLANIKQTLWISNNDTELGGLSMPWSYIANTFRYVNMHHVADEPERKLPDGEITDTTKTAVVLVIGESARKANFSLYGYKRQTNPLLSKQTGVTVIDAQSCGTYTTAGVRSIVEPTDDGTLYEILPNYAFRTGVDVVWRTVNWGEPPVHIDEYMNQQALHEAYPSVDENTDAILFAGIKERILKSTKPKVLIILHTTTSHGPDYCLRVPKTFQKFTPILDNVEEADKNPQALVNAYDNSILYTDYLLSNLINDLRSLTDWNTAMLFVSDHGESLGEKDMYMHGIPMGMAPREQYEIPFIVWTSDKWKMENGEWKMENGEWRMENGEWKMENGKWRIKQFKTPIDQHYVFHSVIDLLGIKTQAYQQEKDIFIVNSLK